MFLKPILPTNPNERKDYFSIDIVHSLKAVDPVAFRCGLGDYESEIQAELEEALDNEDYSDIDWIEELEEDEE